MWASHPLCSVYVSNSVTGPWGKFQNELELVPVNMTLGRSLLYFNPFSGSPRPSEHKPGPLLPLTPLCQLPLHQHSSIHHVS